MIRVVVCSPNARERTGVRAIVNHVAEQAQIANVHTALSVAPEDLVAMVQGRRSGYIDLVVCRVADSLPETLAAALAMRGDGRNGDDADGTRAMGEIPFVAPYVILLTSDKSAASEAFGFEGVGVYADTEPATNLARMVLDRLKEIARAKRKLRCLKSIEGLDNVQLSEFLFAETGKKGPVIHLPNGGACECKGTMRSLFEALSEDSRFMRVGSSFIVNLDNVRSLGEGSVIFSDGETIIAPVRARQPLREALASYHAGVSA